MQPPPFIRYHGSVALEIFCIDMCTFTSSKIRTPPYTEQLTMVSVMSLLQRFLYTGLFTVVPVVSLLQRFLYTGLFTVVPVVSLLQRFLYTGLFTVVPVVSLVQRFHCMYTYAVKQVVVVHSYISQYPFYCLYDLSLVNAVHVIFQYNSVYCTSFYL